MQVLHPAPYIHYVFLNSGDTQMKMFQSNTKWEYKVAYVDSKEIKDLESRMNRKGRIRWELVATVPDTDNDFRLIFKRPA